MTIQMKPYAERIPYTMYRVVLRFILENRVRVPSQSGTDAWTTVSPPPHMCFHLENGAPIITERKIFWKQPVGEMFAFVNGARTLDEIAAFGCTYWSRWATAEKCAKRGLREGDLGPGSYGAAFHDFPMPAESADKIITEIYGLIADVTSVSHRDRFDAAARTVILLEKLRPRAFNQFKHLVEQTRELPHLRTHRITPYIPYYIGRGAGKQQKVVVVPCHGNIHVEIIGKRLVLRMHQDSADCVIGVPSDMVMYASLTLALAQTLGYEKATYIHSFSDAHIYDDHLRYAEEMLSREPRPFPTLTINEPEINDIFAFRQEHFTLSDYNPHPVIKDMPVAI